MRKSDLTWNSAADMEFLVKCESFVAQIVKALPIPDRIKSKYIKSMPAKSMFKGKVKTSLDVLMFVVNPIDMLAEIRRASIQIGMYFSGSSTALIFEESATLLISITVVNPTLSLSIVS